MAWLACWSSQPERCRTWTHRGLTEDQAVASGVKSLSVFLSSVGRGGNLRWAGSGQALCAAHLSPPPLCGTCRPHSGDGRRGDLGGGDAPGAAEKERLLLESVAEAEEWSRSGEQQRHEKQTALRILDSGTFLGSGQREGKKGRG